MKFFANQAHAALGLALVLLASPACEATTAHRRVHNQFNPTEKRHFHSHTRHEETFTPHDSKLLKRSTCEFPSDESNLVAVTSDAENAGWAMSPDQRCTTDSYCPYACKPGMVMAQWDPDATISYPASMNGGIYCNSNGEIELPFPDNDLCVQGTGSIQAVNECGSTMSWCQTVFPGNEAMLIPTVVSSTASIAVPDTSYWCETSAHYYINGPGVGEEGCIWGDDSQAIGNWSPYVVGANTVSNGQTFVKIGWNPEFEKSGLTDSLPDWGLRVECPDGGCNGLPCEINPTQGGGIVNSVQAGEGDAGNAFCVVTVSSGSTANIVAFGGSGGGGGGGDDEEEEEEEEPSTSSPPPPPSTTEEPTTSETPTPTPTPTPTTTSTTTTPTPTSTSTSTTSTTPSSTSFSTSTPSSTLSVRPGIFHENNNSTSSSSIFTTPTAVSTEAEEPSETEEEAAATTSDENVAGRAGSPAFAGLLVAFIGAAYIL